MPVNHSCAHARAIDEAMAEAVGDLVTRADLAVVRADLAALRADMYRTLWIQGGVIIGAVVALIRLIP